MSAPLSQYLAALQVRDQREQREEDTIVKYSQLADDNAELYATLQKRQQEPADEQRPAPSSTPSEAQGRFSSFRARTSPVPPEPAPAPASLTQIRKDFAETQKIRAALETKLAAQTDELEITNATIRTQRKQIAQLEQSKATMERRLRDRAEEIQGKGTFVQGIQDDIVALTLELNMKQQDYEKIEKDNKELSKRLVETKLELDTIKNEQSEKQHERRRR